MQNVLFLGSGFSKNFGGFLPGEVFLEIFNDPEITPSLKEHLMGFSKRYDFESFYQSVIDSENFSIDEKSVINKSILDIYTKMETIFNSSFSSFNASFSYLSLISFILNEFSYTSGGSGYIFSLNQDLLLEKLFSKYLKKLQYRQPGGWKGKYQGFLLPQFGPIDPPLYDLNHDSTNENRESRFLDVISDKEKIDNWSKEHWYSYEKPSRREPCLVKLHGSYYFDNKSNGKVWIIGGKKLDKINEIPLLRCYYDKFSEVMAETVKLFVIGYGFNDEHINKVIASSCQRGSKLIIVDVCQFNGWLDSMDEKDGLDGFSIDWIEKYYNHSFSTLFPLNTDEKNFSFSGGDNYQILTGFPYKCGHR